MDEYLKQLQQIQSLELELSKEKLRLKAIEKGLIGDMLYKHDAQYGYKYAWQESVWTLAKVFVTPNAVKVELMRVSDNRQKFVEAETFFNQAEKLV